MSSENSQIYGKRFPARRLLAVIGDPWTPIVLCCLKEGPRKATELQAQIPGITKKALEQTLRALDADGLVTRVVDPEAGPKPSFRITETGLRLHEPVTLLCEWAEKNEEALDAIPSLRMGSPIPPPYVAPEKPTEGEGMPEFTEPIITEKTDGP